MRKVCISTYCEWSSYGSVMQALGLKRTLSFLGLDSFIVRDMPAPVPQKKFPFPFSANPKVLIKGFLGRKPRQFKRILYQRSVEFIKDHLDVQYYSDFDTLRKFPPKADYYLSGSDQIWHPHINRPAFFLDFVPEKHARLSYAASMGVLDIPVEKDESFRRYIAQYDTISVREQEMVHIIERYTNKPVHRHIDPTFLVDADDWRTYETAYPLPTPYILVYAIYWNEKYNKELKILKKRSGCNIVALCPAGRSIVWADKKIYDADPGQFLYLIDHAAAVISSSFHGIAFSLIFNKKFAPVINPNSPARISSLLEILNAPIMSTVDVLTFDLSRYTQINQTVAMEKEKGIHYFKEVLMDE